MLKPAVVEQVEDLVAQGDLSLRQIAAQLGVCRATVRKIARGQRPDYQARRLARRADAAAIPLGPVIRCETCGGRVFAPCKLCEIRALLEGEERRVSEMRRAARRSRLRQLLMAVDRASRSATRCEQRAN